MPSSNAVSWVGGSSVEEYFKGFCLGWVVWWVEDFVVDAWCEVFCGTVVFCGVFVV